MVTFAGRKNNLDDLLHSLIELEFDAVGAYTAAIERLENNRVQLTFEQFRADHRSHIAELSSILRSSGREPPDGADLKGILAKGKVVLGNITGDKGILSAMRSNEDDTNSAYEQALEHTSLTAELHDVFSRNLQDERRHRSWIDGQLTLMGQPARVNDPAMGRPASEEYMGPEATRNIT